MLHPREKWDCDAGQGAENTLSTLARTRTLSALFCSRVGQCRAVLAHVGNRILKLYVSYKRSVYLPCLQIRLAQFDSGSRLHQIKATVSGQLLFFRLHTFAQFLRLVRGALYMRQGAGHIGVGPVFANPFSPVLRARLHMKKHLAQFKCFFMCLYEGI
jgi:hypothetical protein